LMPAKSEVKARMASGKIGWVGCRPRAADWDNPRSGIGSKRRTGNPACMA